MPGHVLFHYVRRDIERARQDKDVDKKQFDTPSPTLKNNSSPRVIDHLWFLRVMEFNNLIN